MDKRVLEKMYADKKAYVEKVLWAALAPMDDFGGEIRGSKINGEDNGAIPPIDNGPLPF